MNALIYARTSSKHQTRESGAIGIDSQIDSCRSFCEESGLTISAIYSDEGVSGSKPIYQRPGFIELMADLSRGDVVIAYDRSRLGRDMMVVLTIENELLRKGCSISTVDGTSEGNSPEQVLVRRMMDSIHQYQREALAVKTKLALLKLKKEGKRYGTIPYGKKLDADSLLLVDNDIELDVIAKAREYRAAGSTWKVVAEMLNVFSTNRAGRPWTLHNAYQVLRARG
jgi:site-specific DNA recombinase